MITWALLHLRLGGGGLAGMAAVQAARAMETSRGNRADRLAMWLIVWVLIGTTIGAGAGAAKMTDAGLGLVGSPFGVLAGVGVWLVWWRRVQRPASE